MTQRSDLSAAHRQGGTSRWVALAVLLLALAMALFDITIVNLTLPSLTKSLGLSEGDRTLSWLVAGYILGYALTLVPAGRVGDRYGHKWVFIGGTLGYVVTGVLVCLSVSPEMLIAMRVLHGIAGGFMIAPITAMIQLAFDGVTRVRAFGYWAATTGVGALIGPILGGLVLDAVGLENGWRWAMALGLVLGVVALALSPLLPNLRGEVGGRFDWVGMGLFSLISIGVVAPLIQGLPSWSWVAGLVVLVALASFIVWERRMATHPTVVPVLRLSLFRSPHYSVGLLSTVLGFACFTSSIYIAVATIWQFGRGESATDTALVTLSFALGAIIGGVLDDRFTTLFKRWDVPVALFLIAAGYAVTLAILTANPQVHMSLLIVPLLFAGIGNGAFIGLNLAAILSTVPDRDAGSSAGLVVTAQRVGSALGAAVILYVTSLPAPGLSESDMWIRNGIYGVTGCLAFAVTAVLLTTIVAAVAPKSAAQKAVEPELDRAQVLQS